MGILPMKQEPCQLLCVDFGSTSIKTVRFSVSEKGEFTEEAEDEWIDYIPDTHTAPDGSVFHLLTPDHFDAILHKLHTQVTAITPQDVSPKNPILVVSGLTNTLTITHKGKTALLLDDPSLTTQLSREEEIIISRTCGTDGLRTASSLMKLLALKKNPGILAALFGSPAQITWNDVTFATALSVVTGFLTHTQQRYTVPHDDLRAFGSHALNAAQTTALLSTLDVLPAKFAISPSRVVKTSFGLVYQINDFQAEAALVSRLFELGLIPQTALVISLDTVGKILTKYLTFEKTIADMSYDTLRNSGRVVKTWIKTFLSPLADRAFYNEMETILTHNPDDAGYVFYPSVKNTPEGLLIAPDGTSFTVNDIGTIPKIHKRHAVVAVVRGVGFEMRLMVERCLTENTIRGSAPIVLYGGLTGHNQHGWVKTLAYTFPSKEEIYTLPLTNGTRAAAVSALTEIPSLPAVSLSFSLTKITGMASGDKQYAEWRKNRPD
jgi:hypothetical protein